MSPRLFIAMIVASIVGGIVYLAMVASEGHAAADSGGASYQATSFFFAALVALVFEVFVLLPTTIFLKAIAKRRLLFILFGVAVWIALAASWLISTGTNTASVFINSYQSLVLGVPVIVAFVLIRGKVEHA